MRLESVERYKGKTFCITLETGQRIYLHEEFVAEARLATDMDVPVPALNALLRRSEERRARERALYLLEYRDHSYAELVQKLEKNYHESIAIKTADRMAELGLLDDARYAKRLAASLIEGKRLGMRRARFELSQKGLDRELIDEVLAPYEEEDSSVERIVEIIQRKYMRSLGDPKGEQRAIAGLARMGHDYTDIRAALELCLEELAEMEENEE